MLTTYGSTTGADPLWGVCCLRHALSPYATPSERLAWLEDALRAFLGRA